MEIASFQSQFFLTNISKSGKIELAYFYLCKGWMFYLRLSKTQVVNIILLSLQQKKFNKLTIKKYEKDSILQFYGFSFFMRML
jgi:hypothetical protein